jgi:hypothetical protein
MYAAQNVKQSSRELRGALDGSQSVLPGFFSEILEARVHDLLYELGYCVAVNAKRSMENFLYVLILSEEAFTDWRKPELGPELAAQILNSYLAELSIATLAESNCEARGPGLPDRTEKPCRFQR